MAHSRSGLKQVQRDAYLLSRTLGDFQAAQRGPVVLGRRLARRSLTRTLFSLLRGAAK